MVGWIFVAWWGIHKGMSKVHSFDPDYAVHPGEYLAEVLAARDLKKTELAKRSGVSIKHVGVIVNVFTGAL
jgi:hypothetical protein